MIGAAVQLKVVRATTTVSRVNCRWWAGHGFRQGCPLSQRPWFFTSQIATTNDWCV